jgi:hypothetical protein
MFANDVATAASRATVCALVVAVGVAGCRVLARVGEAPRETLGPRERVLLGDEGVQVRELRLRQKVVDLVHGRVRAQ